MTSENLEEMDDEEERDDAGDEPVNEAPASGAWGENDVPAGEPVRGAWGANDVPAGEPESGAWGANDVPAGGERSRPQAESAVGSAVRSAAHAAAPTAAGVAGFLPGAAIGFGVAGPPGAVVGGLISGLATNVLARSVQENLMKRFGWGDEEQQAANEQEHPYATLAGELATGLPFFGVGGGAQLATRALSGGIMLGTDLYSTGDPLHALAAGAGGAAMGGKFTPLGEKVTMASKPLIEKFSTKLARNVQDYFNTAGGEKPNAEGGDPTMTAGLQRNVLQRGRSGRPTETEPFNTGADDAILEAGAAKATDEGAFPPGHPSDAEGKLGREQDQDSVQTAGLNTAGPVAARGTAESAIPVNKYKTAATIGNEYHAEGSNRLYGKVQSTAEIHVIPEDGVAPDVQVAIRGEPITQQAQQEPPAPAIPSEITPGKPGGSGEPLPPLTKGELPSAEQLLAGKPAPEEIPLGQKLRRGIGGNEPRPLSEAGPRIPSNAEMAAAGHAATARQANQQPQANAEIMTGGGGKKPPAPPPEPPKAPRVPPVPDTPSGARQTRVAAERLDTELHNLTTMQAAEAQDYINAGDKAAKAYPEVLGEGGKTISRAIEAGKYESLPENLKKGYEQGTGEFNKEADEAQAWLEERGHIPKQPKEENYVHRLTKSRAETVADPINEGRLPGMYASSTKELSFRGAQAKDGTRLPAISSDEKGISIWKDGKSSHIENPNEKSLVEGDKFTYKGKEYTVDRGRMEEIQKHATHEDGTPVEYHENAFLSAYARHRDMTSMKRYYEFLEKFKNGEGPYARYTTRDDQLAKQRGWKQSEIDELKGVYMPADLEQAIHNNYNPGLGIQGVDWMRALNQFAVRSIFWNPVPHSMNSFMHYLVARGWDWTKNPTPWFKSMFEGFKAAYTQDALLQDLNRAGASLVMSKINSQRMLENIGGILHTEFKNNPGPWEEYARKWGLGKGIDVINLVYDKASKALWTFSDALMASRIRELEMRGMSRQDAIDNARIHMPDYRTPITMFGSRNLVRAMSDKNLAIFGRYHMGVFNSLSHMVMNLAGPSATMAERKEALGNVLALGVLGLVVKPALDLAVQSVTGNKKAETRPRGPLAPLSNAYEVAQGKRDVGMALGNIFTFSPAVKMISQLISNRDFAGRSIMEQGSPMYKKAGQLLEYGAGNLVSPYGTFAPTIQPGSSKGNILHELATQLTDTSVPTKKQIKGKQYGEKKATSMAKSREKHPRGLIEYGLGKASNALKRGTQ